MAQPFNVRHFTDTLACLRVRKRQVLKNTQRKLNKHALVLQENLVFPWRKLDFKSPSKIISERDGITCHLLSLHSENDAQFSKLLRKTIGNHQNSKKYQDFEKFEVILTETKNKKNSTQNLFGNPKIILRKSYEHFKIVETQKSFFYTEIFTYTVYTYTDP